MLKHWSWWKFFASVIFILFALIFVVGYTLLQRAAVRALEWNNSFVQSAERSVFSLAPELGMGFLSGVQSPLQSQTWLLLGTDEVEGSGRENILTDTIMVVQYDPTANAARLLSLPRDFYYAPWQTKVNGLYLQAIREDKARPQDEVVTRLQELTGLRFDGVIVLAPADIERLIDLAGGVTIDVPQAFTDERFPRSGVDVTKERDPKILYETLVFEQGSQKMDGATAVKYMRSRYSSQVGEGGDEARVRRQQQVIEALVENIVRPDLALRPRLLGALYRWYSDRFESDMSLYDLGFTLGQLVQTKQVPGIEKISLPVTDYPQPLDEKTLLVHPPEHKYKQWVYELVDPTGKQLRAYLQEMKLLP